jgi:hypothetical protein
MASYKLRRRLRYENYNLNRKLIAGIILVKRTLLNPPRSTVFLLVKTQNQDVLLSTLNVKIHLL